MSQWDIYWGLNYTVNIMAQPYTRVLCFLSYIQGEDVQDWVTHKLCWLRNEVHTNHVLPNNPWLWAQMLVHFENAFVDTMTQARAWNELSKLWMEGGHINEYIAKFEWYVSMSGYNVNKPMVLDKFIKGLPNPLAKMCIEMDNPNTWDKWKVFVCKRQEVYLQWWQLLGVNNDKKDQSSKKKDFNKWQQGFNSKRASQDPNTMDTTPGHTRAWCMTTEERAHLMNKGKCFNCQWKGCFNWDCPQSPSPSNRDRTPHTRKGKTKREELEEELSEAEEEPTPKIKASKRKVMGEELIEMVKDTDNEVKDYIIQNVFMKQDFWEGAIWWPGCVPLGVTMCILQSTNQWKYPYHSEHVTPWPIKEFWWIPEPRTTHSPEVCQMTVSRDARTRTPYEDLEHRWDNK